MRRGRRQREKFHKRATDGRKNGREIRDKETDTDNEKTSTVKKEAGGRFGRKKKRGREREDERERRERRT